jgi:hypothetical protein
LIKENYRQNQPEIFPQPRLRAFSPQRLARIQLSDNYGK